MTRSRLGRAIAGWLLLACLSGCAGADPQPDSSPADPTAGQQAGESPSDHDAPPLGKPRAKKLPGDVPEEAEPADE